jgi:hypothetical protein
MSASVTLNRQQKGNKEGQAETRTIVVVHSRRALLRFFCPDLCNKGTQTRTHLSDLQDILAAPR